MLRLVRSFLVLAAFAMAAAGIVAATSPSALATGLRLAGRSSLEIAGAFVLAGALLLVAFLLRSRSGVEYVAVAHGVAMTSERRMPRPGDRVNARRKVAQSARTAAASRVRGSAKSRR